MTFLAQGGQVVRAVVFPFGGVFAVVDFQPLFAVAESAFSAVADFRLLAQRRPKRRRDVSAVSVRTGNAFSIFHASHYIPFSAASVNFSVVPKRRLGMRPAKRRFAPLSSFRNFHSARE